MVAQRIFKISKGPIKEIYTVAEDDKLHWFTGYLQDEKAYMIICVNIH